MINFDMVGRLRGDTLLFTAPVRHPADGTSESCNEDGFYWCQVRAASPGDHTSLHLEDIPVLHFFTGQHPDYHKPSDTPDKINYDGIVRIVDFVERVIRRLNAEAEWEFTPTKDQDEDSTRFKVPLGVIPDCSTVKACIDGVSEGRRSIGGVGTRRCRTVHRYGAGHGYDDVHGCLSLFEAGQTSEVVVSRKGATQHSP